jgi:uncharacterized protein (DUF952 family)
MILHLVSKAEWDAKPTSQPYVPDAFAVDGFIHATQGEDLLLQVANSFYKDKPGDFLVLVIDDTRVTAPIKWETPTPAPAPSPQPSPKGRGSSAGEGEVLPPEVKAEYGDAPISPAPLPASSAAPLFPHIYGPLNRDAIVEIRRAARAPDGTFTSFAPLPPQGMRLKTPSELANELVDATGEFSDALSRYKDRVQARMDEIDKNIKDKLGD